MMSNKLSEMSYSALQERLRELFPGGAARMLAEQRKELEKASTEQLLTYAEYVRRNIRWGHSESECITYEDAAKLLILPELISRLEGKGPR